MNVESATYRDEHGTLVDSLEFTDSRFTSAVLIHGEDEDDSLVVRAQTTDGTTVEHSFHQTERQYTGLASDEPSTMHDDLKDALMTLGFAVEPDALFDSVGDDA